METHLRSAVILGAFPKKRNNKILITMRKRKIEKQKQKEEQKGKTETILMNWHNDTPIQMSGSFEAKQRLQPRDWERVELRYWGKHRLPYISDVNRKLPKTETLALIRSNAKTCSRISQACRQNSVFVINSNKLKHLDDIKSDLNSIFKRWLKAKCKIFDINDKYVRAILSNKTTS